MTAGPAPCYFFEVASLARVLDLRFIPTQIGVALLLLRVWVGIPLMALHGWGKLVGYGARADRFADPFGIGSPASLALSIFAEVVCAALVVLGLFARPAALVCAINMTVAFVFAHNAALTGPRNGELALMYLGGFLVLLLAGPGRFSLDARRGAAR